MSKGEYTGMESYTTRRILGLVVPKFGLEYLGRHGLDIFLSVIFGDSC